MYQDFFEGEQRSWEKFLVELDRREPGGADKFIRKIKERRRQELAERKCKIKASKHPFWAATVDAFNHWGEDFFCNMHGLN